MLVNNSARMSENPDDSPMAATWKRRAMRRVIRSTAMRLANSPAFAPPMPSLTAKMKSIAPSGASPVLPRW